MKSHSLLKFNLKDQPLCQTILNKLSSPWTYLAYCTKKDISFNDRKSANSNNTSHF